MKNTCAKWVIDLTSLGIANKIVYIMLCFDIEKDEVVCCSGSAMKLKCSNLVRSIKTVLEKNNNNSVEIFYKSDSELSNYEDFGKLSKDYNVRLIDLNSEKSILKSCERMRKEVLDFKVEGKSLIERNYSRNMIQDLVKKWNQRSIIDSREKGYSIELVEKRLANLKGEVEVVERAPYLLTREAELTKSDLMSQIVELSKALVEEKNKNGDVKEREALVKVCWKLTDEISKKLDAFNVSVKPMGDRMERVEESVNKIKDHLISKKKDKGRRLPRRDAIDLDLFHKFLLNAGSLAKYQKAIKRSQLRIGYTVLFYTGIRINELNGCPLEDIRESLISRELPIKVTKTNEYMKYYFTDMAIEDLKSLEADFCRLEGFKYLFHKSKIPSLKHVIRMVNGDLRATLKTFNRNDKITSHSFRISVVTRWLSSMHPHEAAEFIGHKDLRSTMRYNRFKLTKSDRLDKLAKSEKEFFQLSKSKNEF